MGLRTIQHGRRTPMYMLIDKDLWEVTEGTEVCPLPYSDDDSTATASQKAEREKEIVEWNKKNNKARAAIVLSVTDGPKGDIQSESTAKGMWDKLKKLYEEQGYNARYLALTSLISTRYEDMKSIEEYTSCKSSPIVNSRVKIEIVKFPQGTGSS